MADSRDADAAVPEAAVPVDPAQRAVLELPDGVSAVVIGAPGSGKTSCLIELLADRAARFGADSVLAIAANRTAAAGLRARLAARIGMVSTGPLARTAAALAYELAASAAAEAGSGSIRLMSGAEQDLVIRELLQGHRDDGDGPAWPEPLDEATTALPVFRTELRELLARATEYGVGPEGLAELGRRHGEPSWVAAGEFFAEYREVLALSRERAFDLPELFRLAELSVRDGAAGIGAGRVGAARVGALRLVAVDDAQQLTEGALRLLAALAERGVAIVAFGDPDLAVNGFRGGETDALARLALRLASPGGPEVARLGLDRVHRGDAELRALVTAVTGRIGAAGAGRQRAAAAVHPQLPARPAAELVPNDPGSAARRIHRVTAPSRATLAQAIARELREAHLLHGVPWSSLAVAVRSGGAIGAMARELAAAHVPTTVLAGSVPLREAPAALALLRLVQAAARLDAGDALGDAEAEQLLTGPYGGIDQVALRRLRMALRQQELATGGTRLGPRLVADAIADPIRLIGVDHPAGRRAKRFAELLAAIRAAAARGASVEELLWVAWDRSGVAESWHEASLGTGLAAEEANRALDAVVALFAAARRAVERDPATSTDSFLAQVLDAEVPEDTLAARSLDDAVLVSTAAGLVGTEFHTVVVAGLQDGAWPDLRQRGTLLGAPRLDAVLQGHGAAPPSQLDARAAVLGDELRMLALAVSRASDGVLLAAVESDDEVPSPVFRMLAPLARAVPAGRRPLHLRGLTGALRRELTVALGPEQDARNFSRRAASEQAGQAAAALAALAAADVPGADPAEWNGLLPPSTTAPIWDLDDPAVRVPVSPSKLEALESNPMEWFVSNLSGGDPGIAAKLGTLLHDVLERTESPDAAALWGLFEERADELFFDAPWQRTAELAQARQHIDALADYLARAAAAGHTVLGAEQRFELETGQAVVRGSIDRLELRDDGVHVVDLKTGDPVPAEAARAHPQLQAYQLAYLDGAVDSAQDAAAFAGAELLFTKQGSGRSGAQRKYTVRAQTRLDAEAQAEFRARLQRAAELSAGPEFPAVAILEYRRNELLEVHLPGEVTGV